MSVNLENVNLGIIGNRFKKNRYIYIYDSLGITELNVENWKFQFECGKSSLVWIDRPLGLLSCAWDSDWFKKKQRYIYTEIVSVI